MTQHTLSSMVTTLQSSQKKQVVWEVTVVERLLFTVNVLTKLSVPPIFGTKVQFHQSSYHNYLTTLLLSNPLWVTLMKLLFSHFRFLTEILLPKLAIEYKWPVIHEADIKTRICSAIGVPVPAFPSRTQISTHDLKQVIALCYKIVDNPLIFLFLWTQHQ